MSNHPETREGTHSPAGAPSNPETRPHHTLSLAKSKQEPFGIESALPHALGQEKAVLSVFMQHPNKLAEPHGLTARTFYNPAHQIMFRHFQEIAKDGKPEDVELVALVQRLIDSGELESVGGPAAITEIATYSPGASHFAGHCQTLHKKHGDRLLVLAGHAAVNNDEVEHSRLIQERDEIIQIASKNNRLLDRLEALKYDPSAPPPVDEICLKLLGRPVGSRGNLLAVQGKQKSGKSAVVGAIIGAAIRGNYSAQGDTLGFEWHEEATGAILHLDTEQSCGDWHEAIQRAELRSGIPQTNRLNSYSIVTFQVHERIAALQQKMQSLHDSGGIDIVILDGVADFTFNVLDPEQACTVVSELMGLAHKFKCMIVTVIHENPGDEGQGKTRGHLGSELQRKAYGNVRIDKERVTGISTIYATDNRKGDIPKTQGLCFAWDELTGMHSTLGIHSALAEQKRENEKTAMEFKKWIPVFESADPNGTKATCPELSAAQASKIIRDRNGTEIKPSEDTTKKQMQRAESLGVLRKTGRGTWTLNQTGQTGQTTGQGGHVPS